MLVPKKEEIFRCKSEKNIYKRSILGKQQNSHERNHTSE